MKLLSKTVAGLVVAAVLAGCTPEEPLLPPPPPREAKFIVAVYAYRTDTDATEFVDIPVTIILEATTVATGEGVDMFNVDGTMANTMDVNAEHTPWQYEFFEATEPTNVSLSAAAIILMGEDLTLACHVLAGPGGGAQIMTLDEAPGPGPVGVTCDFVIF